MPDEGFLARWSRRKTETQRGLAPEPELDVVPVADVIPAAAPTALRGDGLAPAPAADPAPPPVMPTLDDVARLTNDSDFSAFVARGVDQAVRRSALKKLFADPHFNKVDMLDVYMDDFTKPSPVSESMLASLDHAKSVFRRLVDEPEPRPEPESQPEPASDDAAAQQPPQPEQLPEQETR
jgi:hypothetical protein